MPSMTSCVVSVAPCLRCRQPLRKKARGLIRSVRPAMPRSRIKSSPAACFCRPPPVGLPGAAAVPIPAPARGAVGESRPGTRRRANAGALAPTYLLPNLSRRDMCLISASRWFWPIRTTNRLG